MTVLTFALLGLLVPQLHAGTGATNIDETLITQTLNVRLSAGLPGASPPFGSDAAGDGSAARPYASLRRALQVAAPRKQAGTGIRIVLAPGIYREGSPSDNWAVSFNFGVAQATSAPLVIEGSGWNRAEPRNTGDVIISGSEDWSGGWTKNGDGTWTRDWPHAFGIAANTYPFGVSDALLRREMVHVNGRTYYQLNPPGYTNRSGTVGGATEGDPGNPNNINGGRLTPEEGSFWVTDAVLNGNTIVTMGRITLRPPSSAPADFDLNAPGLLVEVTTKRNLLQLWLGSPSPRATNIVLRNLTFQHAGSGYGALIQHQNNLLIEDCRFIKNKRAGLVLNPGRNVTLRRVELSENGETGGGMNSLQNARFEYCSFSRNSRQCEIVGLTGWSVCGIKFMATPADNHDITLFRCEARDNRSTGFWWDTGNAECAMIECIATGNSTNGTFIEDNNSVGNNYEHLTATSTTGTTGIPQLGSRPTVTASRSVFARNRPAPGTLGYRLTKSRGIFFSENENAVIEDCLILDNDIQIATYDNTRGENRNFTFRRNLIAALHANQRLYAVGSTWDSQESLTIRNAGNQVIATIKGGWYGLYDGLSGTTNDNLYLAPVANAFPARGQRWGTDKASTAAAIPSLTLAGWQDEHRGNIRNSSSDKSVDSRSRHLVGAAYTGQALVVIESRASLLAGATGPVEAFTLTRVAESYASPLPVRYRVSGEAVAGVDYPPLDGTITIPAGERSASLMIRPTAPATGNGSRSLTVSLVESPESYYIAGHAEATVQLLSHSTPSSRVVNLSIRAVLPPNQPLTVGFTVGDAATPLLLRAAGPSLGAFGVTDAMADPQLTLYRGTHVHAANDDWSGDALVTTTTAVVGAFPFSAPDSRDAAIVQSIDGSGTMQISGANGGTVVAEVYDGSGRSAGRLINLSALHRTGPAADALIAGFTVAGGSRNLLLRAVGPGLSPFNVSGILADPKLAVFDAAGTLLAQNDDVASDLTPVFGQVGAFALPAGTLDAGLVLTLPPGGYTVQVTGAKSFAHSTGLALVELYELP